MSDLTAVENVRKHKSMDFARTRSLLPNLRDLRGPASAGADGAITAVLYNDQIDALGADEAAIFRPAADPGAAFAVRRTADPPVPWDSSTSRVRFQRDGAGPAPPPDAAGWLEAARKPRELLGVPASAILQSPEGPFVLTLAAPAGGARFEKRPIQIGETFLKQGFAVVLSGLRPHERIVARAAFFVDADRRLGHALDGVDDDRGGSAP